MSGRVRRALATVAVVGSTVAAGVLGSTTPAAADAAGPTDYVTTVTAIEPESDAFDVEIIGGDSFVQLTSDRSAEIVVVGYAGEPYLRFGTDGAVQVNERSPARWLNDDRYGTEELPDEADATAEPVWVEVADDGRYAWHDHRTHWMNEARPPGVEPGDTVLEAVVPLTVDGAGVEVAVRSVLQDPPSPWPPALAGTLALLGCAVLIGRRRFGLWRGPLTAAVAVVAGVFGVWAYTSVPSTTGPSVLLWVLPGLAAVSAAGAWWWERRTGDRSPVTDGLSMFAGAELAVWAWQRWDAVTHAVIPSDAPAGLDRMSVVVAGIIGLATLTTLLWESFRPTS